MYITFLDKEIGEAVTLSTDMVTEKNLVSIDKMLPYLYDLYEEAEQILSEGDLSKRYYTKYCMKQSGGKRRIDVPDENLKKYMRKVNDVFVKKFNLVFPQSCYAYVEGRNAKQLAIRHQYARTIIKLDIQNFFNNCTLEFIMKAMEKVYPFCLMDTTIIEVIVKACMLKYEDHYGLPQGAPTSPMLSNIAMIPIDYFFEGRYKNYSRFSDDIYLSYRPKQLRVDPQVVRYEEEIEEWLHFNNPFFQLNKDKSQLINIKKTGGMWVLGMVINKDNNITIGVQNKEYLRSMIFSFLMDVKNGNEVTVERAYHIKGIVGYFKYIEPDYVMMIIQKYEQKAGLDYYQEIENIIHS